MRRWLGFAPGHERALPSLAPDLGSLEASLAAAGAAFDASAPAKVIPALDQGLEQVRRTRSRVGNSRLSEEAKAELADRLTDKEGQLEAALALAQRFAFEVTVDDGQVVPGQTFTVTARAWNQGTSDAVVESLALSVPPGWTVERKGGEERQVLVTGASLNARYAVTVATNARWSQPYWKRNPAHDRYDLEVPGDETLPWSPPEVAATLRYTASSVATTVRRAAVFRYPGPFVGGEKQHFVQVVPALSVRMSPDIAVVPVASPRPQKEFRVLVTNNRKDAATATAVLAAPPGWSVAPREATLRFRYEGEEMAARFFVTPPATLAEGETALQAVVTLEGREFRDGVAVVAYDHIQRRHLVRPAAARVLALDVRTAPAIRIGYVMGPGDAVADAIRQLGAPVTLLTADDLAYANLSEYSTIVIGIRAYETRSDLRSYHPRLMNYVEAGPGRLQLAQPAAPARPRVRGRRRRQPFRSLPRVGHPEPHHGRERAPEAPRARSPALHRSEPHRPARLGGLGAGARDPVPGRPRPALRGAPRGKRPLPEEPRRAEGNPRGGEGGPRHLDLCGPRALPTAPRGNAGSLPPARQPGQPEPEFIESGGCCLASTGRMARIASLGPSLIHDGEPLIPWSRGRANPGPT